MVGQYFPPDFGGGSTRAYNVAKGLLLNGCKVTVVTAFPHYPYGQIPKQYRWKLIKLEQLEGIRVIRTFILPIMSRRLFSRLLLMGVFAVSSLFALPWVDGIDVILADSWMPGIVYGRVKRKHVTLNVNDLTIEDVADLGLLDKDSFVAKLAERIFRFCYVKGDAVTPISPGYVEIISKKYCVDRSKIHVVRGGVDLSIFEKSPDCRRAGQRFMVLYAGVLGEGYDFDQIFRAAKIVKERCRDVEFVLHGGGECLGYIKQRIKEQCLTNVRLSDRILSSRKEVVELLNEADTLILPMKDFGHPYPGIAMKIYEYQAVGKPIICCGEGQPATYIKETGSGIVVKPGDHKGLAEAVIWLKKNKQVAQSMGRNGRKYVENNASIKVVGGKMKEILETLIEGRD